MPYTVMADAAPHTCWDTPDWEGTMQDGCAGCDEAAENQCEFCGYGHVFTTHNDMAHAENGDLDVPDEDDPDEDDPALATWHVSPHIYMEDA